MSMTTRPCRRQSWVVWAWRYYRRLLLARTCRLGSCRRCSEYIPVERHVYAMYLPSRHLPAKVRAFIDFLIARIGTEPYWDRDNVTAAIATGAASRTVAPERR